MPTPTKPRQELRRKPIYPLDLAKLQRRAADGVDLTNALWPWYLVPSPEPDVSPETRAFVMGEYEPADEEEKALLLQELAECGTIRGIGMNPIIQQPGAIAAERGYQKRKGMRIISRVVGEPNDNNQPLEIRGPSLEDDPNYGSIGIKTVVAELERRQPWALAQLQAKIVGAEDMARSGDSVQKRYYRQVVGPMKRALRAWEVGIPTVKELERFFVMFERQRIASRLSAQYLADQATERQVNTLDQQIEELTSGIDRQFEGMPA